MKKENSRITVYILYLAIQLNHVSTQSPLPMDCYLVLHDPGKYPIHIINECYEVSGLNEEQRIRQQGFVKCLYSHCRSTCLFGWVKDRYGCYTCQCAGRGNEQLFEGDILIVGDMRDFLEEVLEDPSKGTVERDRNRSVSLPLWDMYKSESYYIIPYMIEHDIGIKGRAAIQAAARDFAKFTCIRLQPRKYEDTYVSFYNGGRCHSPVGAVLQKQWISLGSACWNKGTVLHQIMHSLGFWHEQSRPERDDNVDIHFENIRNDMGHNFNKQKSHETNSVGSYDVESIMHAGAFDFSFNSKPTITYINGSAITTQNQGLSTEDIKKINQLYDCGNTRVPVVPIETQNCGEREEFCVRLQKLGGCYTYPDFMMKNCFDTCKASYTGCFDMNMNCKQWVLEGFCYGAYSGYMRANCRLSCGMCNF